MKRAMLGVIVALACVIPPQAAIGHSEGTAEILWDSYGVPHIFATNQDALFRGFGWAQAKNHGDLLLQLYGMARGRAAEYWGEQHLASDRWVRLNGVPERAQRWYLAQSPRFRSALDAFAAGINAYATQHPAELSAQMRVVLPVTAVDVLAHVQRVIFFTFIANSAMTTRLDAVGAGSNGWVLAPAHTRNGHAMLLANPHLSWGGPFTMFEAQLSTRGVDAYGATFVGFPVLGIAFNDVLGWTHTVNTIDAADLFELEPAPNGYLLDGRERAFDVETQVLVVKGADGSRREVPLEIRRSVHGVVIGSRKGHPVALRVAGLEEPGMCEEWWDMGRARNLRQFEAALSRLQIPMFTVLYADREGHILHVFNGRVPVRAPGAYDWSGIVPGSSSSLIWQRTHPYADLPRVLDPSSGWLQNSNDPPWTTTTPVALDAQRFPAYMAPRTMNQRAQRAWQLLTEDAHISFEELVADKHSTRMELADRILPELLPAAKARGGNAAAAAAVLEAWDRGTDADSRGAVLFQRFASAWLRNGGGFEIPWDLKHPLETPSRLHGPESAVDALVTAAAALEKTYGALDMRWGDVYRFRRDGIDLPGNGFVDPFGVVRAVGYVEGRDGRFEANSGDSFVAAVEFSQPVRAQVLIGYGNASQPNSRHRTDQLAFMAQKRLRPAWYSRSDVEAHLEQREAQ